MGRNFAISGRDIRNARLQCGLSRPQLAEAAGLHPNTVKRLETFGHVPCSSWFAAERVGEALRRAGAMIDFSVAERAPLLADAGQLERRKDNFLAPKTRARARHGVLVESASQSGDLPSKSPKQECGARTRVGLPCRCKPLPNGRCRLHGGLSTGPKSEAGRQRISAAQKRRWSDLSARQFTTSIGER